MKILFVTTTRYPKATADYFQTLINANELAKFANVMFITRKEIRKEVFEDYSIVKNRDLAITVVPFEGWLDRSLFLLRIGLLILRNRYDVIYTREKHLLRYLNIFPVPLATEVHDINEDTRMIPSRTLIIAITEALKKDLTSRYRFRPDRIMVAPDGVCLENFDVPFSTEKAREITGINGDAVVMYTGSFAPWKGVHVLAAAAEKLPGVLFALAGGNEADTKIFKERFKSKNIHLIGWQPHRSIPTWLKAADILVLPNSASSEISKYYTSPLKLFEYLASKKPIIASDLPSLREILDDRCALFFAPDDPDSLATAIKRLLDSKVKREELASNGFQLVQNYTWESRAKKISHFLRKSCAMKKRLALITDNP